MRISLSVVFCLLFALSSTAWGTFSVNIGIGGSNWWEPRLEVSPVPSFVIAEKGVRHDLNPVYATPFTIIGNVPGYSYVCRCSLISGPPGMTVSEEGVVLWMPAAEAVGQSRMFQVQIDVEKDGQAVFTTTKQLGFRVVDEMPKLQEPTPIVFHERDLGGRSGIMFSGFQPSDTDRKYFKWSLIDPPPGVYITDEGYLNWPDDRGYSRNQDYVFKVRIDYETASGVVSDEVTYRRRVLPREATNDFFELRNRVPSERGMLGFSLAAADGWVAGGEPFPDFAWTSSTNPNAGRVKLWRTGGDGRYVGDPVVIEPQGVSGRQAFGASLAMSAATAERPLRMVVGAPESTVRGREDAGNVWVYACDDSGNWHQEASLEAPMVRASAFFGGWVALDGDVLLASMEGENSSGWNAGSLVVFRHGANGWRHSQTLMAPDGATGDFFGYPAEVDGEWIAAAANEDDDSGLNTGSVHLYQWMAGRFVHRQKLLAPVPQAGSNFGERLEIQGRWLFVSAFRQDGETGVVHVFRRSSVNWEFHQTLHSPFANEGARFGADLDVLGDVLAVSAPGYFFGSTGTEENPYPWKGITLFKLVDDQWQWHRQVTEPPSTSPHSHTWGFGVVQASPHVTIASMPDHMPYENGAYHPAGGRLFVHRWPDETADPLLVKLAALPEIEGRAAGAADDSNGDGLPNVIEWMMGYDPGVSPGPFASRWPQTKRPFLRRDEAAGDMTFMVPKLSRGLGLRAEVEVSEDLVHWQPVTGARWGGLEVVAIKTSENVYAMTEFHPVTIPALGNARSVFVRLSVR